MNHGGLVIGLGGSGTRVVLRVRQALASTGQARVPDSIRLLAFDQHKPTPATSHQPPSYSFLIHLPPLDDPPASPAGAGRQAAREVLLADLAQGAASSRVLRGLASQLDALHRARVSELSVFLVCSSFGETGTAWLLDLAYLVRHLTRSRIKTCVHAMVLVPEAFERAFFPNETQRLTNFVFLRELEALQRERSWEKGFSLYGGKYIGSLPGQLTARPFDSVQVVDALEMNSAPEASAIPAAADGILSQLDAQVAGILDQFNAQAGPRGNAVFTTFGTFSLVYPTRLVLEQAIQRLLIGAIEQIFPLEKNPDNGHPTGLAEPAHLRPDDPYGKLGAWLPAAERSGVLQDILRAAEAPGKHSAFRAELAGREPEQWQALLQQCSGAETPQEEGDASAEAYLPLVQGHVHQFLAALGERLTHPDSRLGAPLAYLQKLERAAAAYMEDLDAVSEIWREGGERPGEAAGSKRGSLLGRLIAPAAQDTHPRPGTARRQHQQREVALAVCQQSAAMIHALSRRLWQFGQRMLQALALRPDSVYNQAMEQLQRLEREARFETAVRSQQLVVDQGYENSQTEMAFHQFGHQLNETILAGLQSVEKGIDWKAEDPRLPFLLADPNLGGEPVDLDDPDLPLDQLAALFNRALAIQFAEALLRSQPDNTVTNFLSYLDPRADRLGSRMVASSGPLARLITPSPARRNILFSPRPNSSGGSIYTQELLAELHHHLGEVHVYPGEDVDRLSLFRYFDGISVDNLLTFHQSEPRNPNLAELKNYLLWNL